MPDLVSEYQRLRQIDHLVVASETRVTKQRFRIVECREAGRDTEVEEYLLGLYEASLSIFYNRRAMVLEAIKAAEAARPAGDAPELRT